MKRIIDHGDVIEIISGGADEWAASNAIIAEARARWEAEAAAKNGEVEVAQSGGKHEHRGCEAITAHDKSLV